MNNIGKKLRNLFRRLLAQSGQGVIIAIGILVAVAGVTYMVMQGTGEVVTQEAHGALEGQVSNWNNTTAAGSAEWGEGSEEPVEAPVEPQEADMEMGDSDGNAEEIEDTFNLESILTPEEMETVDRANLITGSTTWDVERTEKTDEVFWKFVMELIMVGTKIAIHYSQAVIMGTVIAGGAAATVFLSLLMIFAAIMIVLGIFEVVEGILELIDAIKEGKGIVAIIAASLKILGGALKTAAGILFWTGQMQLVAPLAGLGIVLSLIGEVMTPE